MSSEHLPTTQNGEYIQPTHLLSSDKAGWEKLSLVYELEPAGETPETVSTQNLVIICLGDCRGSFKYNGTWHHEDYSTGDIVFFPARELFPRVKLDRSVPLIELFLEPEIIIDTASEIIQGSKIELSPQYKLRDPLIQQMGLALKTELEMGGVDSKLYADSIATALSLHLLRRYATAKPKIQNYSDGLPSYQLNKVIDYIHEHVDWQKLMILDF